AVLRAAGGMTRTLDGKPLAYGKRKQRDDAEFANPHFIASGKVARPT
ncbi:MAG: 3'(2'),5'-bisphosphate nucleotidase CysQ, partial [Mesorhizobium sp.]